MSALWIAGFSLAFSALLVLVVSRVRRGPDIAGLTVWQAFLATAIVVAALTALFAQFPRAWGPFLAAALLASGAGLLVARGRELTAGGNVDQFARLRPFLAGAQLVAAVIIVLYALLAAGSP